MDREKVISEFEDFVKSFSKRDDTYYKGLFVSVLALLKEQEAVEHEWIYKHDNLWYCSRCGEIIYSETDDDLEIHHAYCSRCGAKMKQEGR